VIEFLNRKVKPSEIVSGEARVGRKGSEYTNPQNYIPADVLDLVADKIHASTKRQPTVKLAEERKTAALIRRDTIQQKLIERRSTSAPPLHLRLSFEGNPIRHQTLFSLCNLAATKTATAQRSKSVSLVESVTEEDSKGV
jgi:hypothetical protein